MKSYLTGLPHALFFVFFVAFLAVGLYVYNDYGVPVDEYSQMELGRVNYERIITGSRELEKSFDRYYGPVFETVLHATNSVVCRVLGIGVIESRHLLVFLYYAASVAVFFAFLTRITGSPWYGLLGTVFLVLSPRQFAQGFYNSKDMVMLSTGIFLLYSLTYATLLQWMPLIVHSLLSGYALAIRPQTVVFVGASIVAMVLATKRRLGEKAVRIGVYVSGTVSAALLFLPILWDDPFRHLQGMMARALDPVGVWTLYMGSWYRSPDMPWHYLPVMITITTPLFLVALFIPGVMLFIRSHQKRKWQYRMPQAMFVAALILIAETLLFTIALRARVYDGWRHIFYLYPSFVMFAVYALSVIVKQWHHAGVIARRTVGMIAFLVVVDVIGVLLFMVRNHPHQYVYYNPLVGGYGRAFSYFDGDYWGISYKQILERLLRMPPARVYFREVFPYVENEMIPVLVRAGYEVVGMPDDADLFVTVYRNSKVGAPKEFDKVYAITVGGADVSAIYASAAYQFVLAQP